MATDQRDTRPTRGGADRGSDVGGIPGTMKRGVAEATDRKAARREALPDNDVGSDTARNAGSAMSGSTESGAHAPKEGIDRTGRPAVHREGGRRGGDHDADSDRSGQDDSIPESLGKSISEPFRSS